MRLLVRSRWSRGWKTPALTTRRRGSEIPPVILTTAIVIFGAWRSAVKAREPEAEALDQDE